MRKDTRKPLRAAGRLGITPRSSNRLVASTFTLHGVGCLIGRINAGLDAFRPILNERKGRFRAGSEAVETGRGGFARVSLVVGLPDDAVRSGLNCPLRSWWAAEVVRLFREW